MKTITMKEEKKSASNSKKVACVILRRSDNESLAEFHASTANVSDNDIVQMEAKKVAGKNNF